MNVDDSSPHPEPLLSQVEWARALARSLVRDPGSADDLAQSAFLAAWQRPPEGIESPHRLRAWLARVLSNAVREERRSALHRRAREEEAARGEAQRSAAEVVERAATHRALVEGVLALPEPYRATILLRYFDGLSTARIARRLSVSEPAVRKRLSRGVAMLRERLAPQNERDGHAWSIALLQLAGEGGRTSVAWSTYVGAMMGKKASLVALLLLAVIAGILGLRPSASEASVLPITPQVALLGEPVGAPALARSRPESMRVAQGAPANSASTLRVVVDGTREPLAGAELYGIRRATRAELVQALALQWDGLGIAGAAERWLALVEEEAIPADPFASDRPPFVPRDLERVGTTDAEGRVDVDELREGLADRPGLVVRDPRHVPLFVPAEWLARSSEDERELALPARCALRVRLVDASSGAPVAGAFARLELDCSMDSGLVPRPILDPLRWHGPTDAAGELEVSDLPAGATVWVTALGEFSLRPASAWLDPASPTSECELRVWRVGGLSGRVVRADGTPAAGVPLFWRGPWALASHTQAHVVSDEGGEFRVDDVLAGCGRLSVEPRIGALASVDLVIPPGGRVDAGDVIAPELVEFSGHLVVPEGETLGQFAMELWSAGILASQGAVSPDGSFACLVPAGRYEMVSLLHDGWLRTEVARAIVHAPADDVEIDLGPQLGALRASLPAGFPDMRAVVRLTGSPDPAAPNWTLKSAVTREAWVADGALVVQLLPPGVYDVEVGFGDLGTARFEGVRLEGGRVSHLGELGLEGGILEGRVTDAGGRAVAGARVQLAVTPLAGLVRAGASWRRDTDTDEDGNFRLRALDARAWTAWAEHPELGVSAVRSVAISNGGRTSSDFELTSPCFVRGHVLRRGEPVRDAVVEWSESEFSDQIVTHTAAPTARPDEAGSYELGPFLPGEYRVFAGVDGAVIARKVRLAPGESVQVDFELVQALRRVQLMAEGRPLQYIENVRAECFDSGSPHFGATSTGVLRGIGLVELALPPARVVLRLALGRFEAGTRVSVFVDGRGADEELMIDLPSGVLELALPPDRRVGERPVMHVLGSRDQELPRADALRIVSPAEHAADTVRFPCLAPGTRCLLVGPGTDGSHRERVVTYVGPGVQRVVWE